MKADKDAAKRLTSLLKRLKSQYQPEEPHPGDPVSQMVLGFLQWQATSTLAEQAFTSLMAEMVDINELRVSHDHEIVAVIGQSYPLAKQRVARMREVLNEIYVREHAVAMNSIANHGKKDQRTYLDSLPGMTPYVAALVTLLVYTGHAMPVDHKLIELLADEKIVDAGADSERVESFLLRQIKASDALGAHLLLQAWADDKNPPGKRRSAVRETRKTAKSSDAEKSRTTKRSTKKTTKQTTKRTTATRARKK